MNKLVSLLPAAFLVAACEGTVNWPEEGIWECENKFDGRNISFDTQAPSKGVIDLNTAYLVVTDLKTDLNVRIDEDSGWVCTMPSGKEFAFESTLE